jgi:hypothetical protein
VEDQRLDGCIILKWSLKKYDGRLWAEFIRFRKKTRTDVLYEPSGSIKSYVFPE